jgi:hypothetical protein
LGAEERISMPFRMESTRNDSPQSIAINLLAQIWPLAVPAVMAAPDAPPVIARSASSGPKVAAPPPGSSASGSCETAKVERKARPAVAKTSKRRCARSASERHPVATAAGTPFKMMEGWMEGLREGGVEVEMDEWMDGWNEWMSGNEKESG